MDFLWNPTLYRRNRGNADWFEGIGSIQIWDWLTARSAPESTAVLYFVEKFAVSHKNLQNSYYQASL
jgi:hypothetical protein